MTSSCYKGHKYPSLTSIIGGWFESVSLQLAINTKLGLKMNMETPGLMNIIQFYLCGHDLVYIHLISIHRMHRVTCQDTTWKKCKTSSLTFYQQFRLFKNVYGPEIM